MFTLLAEHYGNIASVAGLLVALVGFWYTIRQVKMTRSAAEVAAASAKRLHLVVLSERLRHLLELLRDCDEHNRRSDRAALHVLLARLHSELGRVSHSPAVQHGERRSLVGSVRELEVLMQDNSGLADLTKLIQRIRLQITKPLERIDREVQEIDHA